MIIIIFRGLKLADFNAYLDWETKGLQIIVPNKLFNKRRIMKF